MQGRIKFLQRLPKYEKLVKKKANYRFILSILEKRPHTRSELLKITKIKETTLDSIISRLRNENSIKNIDIKILKENHPDSDTKITDKLAYALYFYEPEKEKIKSVLLKQRIEFFKLRWLTIEELSEIIGKSPENVKKVIYEIAPKIGWSEPTKEDVEFTKISLKVLTNYLTIKNLINNTILKNGELLVSDINMAVELMGAEYDISTNTIRAPIPSDAELGEIINTDKKITKAEWERINQRLIWGSVRGIINEYLPNKKDKIKFSDWLRRKTYSDIKGFKIKFSFKPNSELEIIDSIYFRTIANVAFNLTIKQDEL